MTIDTDYVSSEMVAANAGAVAATADANATSTSNSAELGFVPIVLPHKNRARYVILTKEVDRSIEPPQSIYQIIETSQSSLVAGGLAFTFLGPVIIGIGITGQISKDFDSIRHVSGRVAAFLAPELYPPRSLKDVLAWPDKSTTITYESLRGLKLTLGVYAIAHAGTTFEIEGIWAHRVTKHEKSITVALILTKQMRFKGTLGVTPISANNLDFYHLAHSTELNFTFNDIDSDPKVKSTLEALLNTHCNSAILQAKQLAEHYALLHDEYAQQDLPLPITFNAEHQRTDKDPRARFRLRLPLLCNYQRIYKKRDRIQQSTFHHANQTFQTRQFISETMQRVEKQLPIDRPRWNTRSHIYPNRMNFNWHSGFNWPLDYKNKSVNRITQIIHIENGDDSHLYEHESVRYLWQLSDNYISKKKFIAILEKIGQETALTPLLLTKFDIPSFTGPINREQDKHESMLLSMHVIIRDYEKAKVYENILHKNFIENTLALFDAYLENPYGDYLKLSNNFTSKNEFKKLYRNTLQQFCINVVYRTLDIQKKLQKNRKSTYFGFSSTRLTTQDKMHYDRKRWQLYRENPFVFLMALEGCSPKCHINISGTSTCLDRHIELSLALDIMRSRASIPHKYVNNLLSITPSQIPTNPNNKITDKVYPDFNLSDYYSENFVPYLQENNIKKIAVVVTSWSDGALLFPRSTHIGSRQARDLPHHILMAQKLNQLGIFLKIYYLAFDNTQHFNQKDKRAMDTNILPAYLQYLQHFANSPLKEAQLETVYLNPQYIEKEGDVVIKELEPITSSKGDCLSFSGSNAIAMKTLQNKLNAHKKNGDLILGMTAHSSGHQINKLGKYLGLEIIGSCETGLKYGTKEGNKQLFELAGVPYVYGTHKAFKDIDELISYCYLIILRTQCKRLMIKHNSSSAGKGNLIIDVSSCYNTESKNYSFKHLKSLILNALLNYKHAEKDKDIRPGSETFYMRKIREIGAIVELMVDDKIIVSPGCLALVQHDGTVDVEYVYDQILSGKNNQNFGGSIGPSQLDKSDIEQINSLTRQIGLELFKQGFQGYFGLDFLKVENAPMIVIEANIRKTGTRYPYMLMSHLLDNKVLKEKHLFHDDNIGLPLGLADFTGRNLAKNHYMSALYYFFINHPLTFTQNKGIGAIVSFDTHSAGKLGVLTIGNSRNEALLLSQQFRQALDFFTDNVYFRIHLPKQNYGLNQAYLAQHTDPSTISEFDSTPHANDDSVSLSIQVPPKTLWFERVSAKINLGTNKFSKQILDLFQSADSPLSPKNKQNILTGALPDSPTKHSPPNTDLVFSLLGRTRTCDYLLLKAAQQGMICYRMTEDSKLFYNPKTGKGHVTHVHVPLIDARTGNYKVYFDKSTKQPLPTVVYNYDFSAARRLFHQGRGSKIFFDNSQDLQSKLALLNPEKFNDINPAWIYMEMVSPLRSQLAFSQLLKKFSPDLYKVHPKCIALSDNPKAEIEIVNFIKENKCFYIKRALAAHDPHNHQTQIYVEQNNDEMIFEYFLETFHDECKSISAKFLKIPLDTLDIKSFMNVIKHIKQKMSVAENVQFILQQSISQIAIQDMSQRPLRAKLRVVTLHHPHTNEIESVSFYGVYGAKNAYLGYVGDPNIYLQAAILEKYIEAGTLADIETNIKALATQCHQTLEKGMNSHLGEVVTDIIIGKTGIAPLKCNIKPERLNVEFITQQTHYGTYLEGSQSARAEFIGSLTHQEENRSNLILEAIAKKHLANKAPSDEHQQQVKLTQKQTNPNLKA